VEAESTNLLRFWTLHVTAAAGRAREPRRSLRETEEEESASMEGEEEDSARRRHRHRRTRNRPFYLRKRCLMTQRR